jgi:hypothetical protein
MHRFGRFHGATTRTEGSTGISGGDFRFQISHLTSHIPTIYQHTLHFYATTPIKPDHPPGRESDDSEFIIRSCKFPGCNRCMLQYSEVEQLVRLFNAIKSKMKIKIGAGIVKSEI